MNKVAEYVLSRAIVQADQCAQSTTGNERLAWQATREGLLDERYIRMREQWLNKMEKQALVVAA